MPTNLLPIDQIVKKARQSGTALGHGDPKIHLAYLTKLKLLPQAIRRKIGEKIQGCYPDYILPLLSKIENLRSKGLSYSQIRFQLNENQTLVTPQYATSNNQSLAFLIIGLILGFLLATTNANPSYKPAEIPTTDFQKVVSNQNSSSDPIYLLAIPNQNLYKLGKININELR